MTVNNTDYKDLTIENDGGWICKPVLLARQSLWESDNRRVFRGRSLLQCGFFVYLGDY